MPKCRVRDLQPPHGLAHVAAPVADAFVPAAVVVGPDGIAAVELVHRVIEPRLRLGDLAQEGDPGFADLVPDAVAVAAVGRVQMAGAAGDLAALPGVADAPQRAGLNLRALRGVNMSYAQS